MKRREQGSEAPLHVLKFGSSVLRDERDLPRIVHELYAHLRRGARVVAVVSAIGEATDALNRRARALDAARDSAHTAALLATGEEASSALLALACERAGLLVQRFDAARAGLESRGPLCDASPAGLDEEAIRAALDEVPLLILPGFVGRAACGRTSLFGRGGSDLTALFVAERLDADLCLLVKDVDGLYESDPAAAGPAPRRYETLSWRCVRQLGGSIVQAKALRYACEHGLAFELGGLGTSKPTRIGRLPVRFAAAAGRRAPLRVGLCGLGTVGGGVLARLRAQPECFDVRGALVRDPRGHVGRGESPELLARSADELLERGCDVLVELIGGVPRALELVRGALERGLDVVTANKALLARHGNELEALARACGARLLGSASVGGSATVLEIARRASEHGEVESFEAVLNGTTNFLLGELARGVSFEDALRDAQRRGLAEADPRLDLDGSDVVQKTILVARATWGAQVEFEWIVRRGIEEVASAAALTCRRDGKVLRLVASAARAAGGVRAGVRPLILDASHPLARTEGAANRARFRLADGRLLEARGLGAGRWPTTEAVLADLLELRAARGAPEVLA